MKGSSHDLFKIPWLWYNSGISQIQVKNVIAWASLLDATCIICWSKFTGGEHLTILPEWVFTENSLNLIQMNEWTYLNIQCEICVANAPVCECSGQETDMFEFNTYWLFKLGEILKINKLCCTHLKLALKYSNVMSKQSGQNLIATASQNRSYLHVDVTKV